MHLLSTIFAFLMNKYNISELIIKNMLSLVFKKLYWVWLVLSKLLTTVIPFAKTHEN